MIDSRSCQWMIDAVRKAGYSAPDILCLDLPDTIMELWRDTAEQSGITLDELADIVARHAKLKQADLNSADDLALKFLPEKIAHQYLVFPQWKNG